MSNEMQELIGSVKDLKETVVNRIETIEVANSDAKRDLAELQSQLKDHVANGTKWDEELKLQFLDEIMTKARAEEKKLGVSALSPAIQKTLELPDPWAVGFDPYYFKTMDHKKLLQDDLKEIETNPASKKAKKRTGMDALITLPAMNDQHRNLCRMAMDVKLLDRIGQLMAVQRDLPYEGLSQFFPTVAEAWKFYQLSYMSNFLGKGVTGDAMDTTDTANWVPTGSSSELRELIRLELRVANIFESFPLPQSPFDLAIDLTDILGDFIAETTTIYNPFTDTTGVQKLNDAKVTFTAKKIRGRIFHSGELAEDAVIALVPQIRKHLVDVQAQTRESAIINGQATATIDTGDAPTGTDHRLAFDGLRYYIDKVYGTPGNYVDGATFDADVLIRESRAAMGPEYGVNSEDIVHIPSMSAFLSMLVITEVLTLDKYGPNATIFNGELANIGGAAVVPSRHVRQDLNASGIYDGVTTTKTVNLVVNRRAFMIGEIRNVTLEVQRWVSTDQNELVSFSRYDFQPLYGSAYDVACGIYNIAV